MDIVRRRWRLMALITCGIAALMTLSAVVRSETYTATATLLFRDPGFDQQLLGSSVLEVGDEERAAATNLRLVSLPAVAERTAHALGNFTAAEIDEKVEVAPEGQSDLITVSASAADPETAAEIANVFASEYVEFRREADRTRIADARELVEQDLKALEAEDFAGRAGRALERRISELRALEALQTGNAELVQSADPSDTTVSPSVVRTAGLGLLIGGLIAVFAALVIERLDRRVRSLDELREVLRMPVLATVPELERLGETTIDALPSGSAALHSFLMLRSQLRYFNVDRNVGVVLITSPGPGDGKTTVARHLAAASVLAGESAIVVGADLHQPSLAERLGLRNAPGLTEYLSGQNDLSEIVQRFEWTAKSPSGERKQEFSVIGAGTLPPNPAELLESKRMAALVGQLRQEYDNVLIDTPPVLRVPDAIPVIRLADGVLVVTRLNGTTSDEAVRLREQLTELGADSLGAVVNHVQRSSDYGGYRYYAPRSSNEQN